MTSPPSPAPVNYPEFAKFRVREGIAPILLDPDSLVKSCTVIAAAERSGA